MADAANSGKIWQGAMPSKFVALGSDGTIARVANLLSFPLILLTPFVAFVRYHDYSLWRPEILLCSGLIVSVGLALSAFVALRPKTLRPLIASLLLLLFVDLQFPVEAGLRPVQEWGGGWAVIAAISSAALVAAVSTWILRRNLGVIVASGFGTVVLTTIALPVETIRTGVTHDKPGEARTDLPPILHIVLDEQIGIEGLPDEIPGAAELRRELTAFYNQHGFAVFGQAYSKYHDTADSLPNLLNGWLTPAVFAHVSTDELQPGRVSANAWFDKLSHDGYRLRVYQSSYLDYCNSLFSALDFCYTYPANSIGSLSSAEIAPSAKMHLVIHHFLNRSFIFRLGVVLVDSVNGRKSLVTAEKKIWLGALPSMQMFGRLADDVRAYPRGTAFFLHLLVPHGSYIFDDACRLRADLATWLRPFDPAAPSSIRNTPESRAQRYALYFDQVRCVHRQLGRLFAELEPLGLLSEATIIVHGDHGSRISLTAPTPENVGRLSEADIADSFSTLFAVKAPGLAPLYNNQARSIQNLFAEMFLDIEPLDQRYEVFLKPADSEIGDPLQPWPVTRLGRGEADDDADELASSSERPRQLSPTAVP